MAPARLARLDCLTAAEARLAAAMSAVRSLGEYMDEAEISINTAPWHLRHFFAKTGTRRQVELGQLPLMSPPKL